MISNSRFLSFLAILSLLVSSTASLYCYECNTLLSAGCENPLKSSSYFYVKCHNDHPFCVQRTTFNGMSTYMERMCAPECGEENITNYDKETFTNICCEEDGCNHATVLQQNHLYFTFLTLFSLIFLVS